MHSHAANTRRFSYAVLFGRGGSPVRHRVKLLMAALMIFGVATSVQASIEQVAPISGACFSSSQSIGCLPSVQFAANLACSTVRGSNAINSATNITRIDATTWRAECQLTGHIFRIIGSVTCPVPTVNSTVAYSYNANTSMCEREVNQYTIEFDPALKGSSTIAIEPGASQATYVRVTNSITKQPQAGVQIRIRVDVESGSGGHEHHTDRPKGILTGTPCAAPEQACITATTDDDGKAGFTFMSTIVSGIHTFTAACVNPTCTNEDSGGQIHVKVEGLEQIPASSFYTLQLPNRDTNHPSTHFLTKKASGKLYDIAMFYYVYTYLQSKQGVIPDFVLNDASLKWGGVLDCFLTCANSVAWGASHHEHRRGTVVDVKANGTPGSIMYENQLRELAALEDVDIGDAHGNGSGRHFHIRLNGKKE